MGLEMWDEKENIDWNVHSGMYIAMRIHFISVLFWIFPLRSLFPFSLLVHALAQWRQRHDGMCLWQLMGSCILYRNAQTLLALNLYILFTETHRHRHTDTCIYAAKGFSEQYAVSLWSHILLQEKHAQSILKLKL